MHGSKLLARASHPLDRLGNVYKTIGTRAVQSQGLILTHCTTHNPLQHSRFAAQFVGQLLGLCPVFPHFMHGGLFFVFFSCGSLACCWRGSTRNALSLDLDGDVAPAEAAAAEAAAAAAAPGTS